jgi:hypothetical protein
MGESAGRAIVELTQGDIRKAAEEALTTGMYLTALPANQVRKIRQAFEDKDLMPVIGYRKKK